MKKVKIVFWLILIVLILGFVGLIGFQNWEYFRAKQSLALELTFPVTYNYQTPEILNAIYWIVCIAVGFLVAYFLGLLKQFRQHKTIKNLNNTIALHLEKINGLENELSSLKYSNNTSSLTDTEEDNDSVEAQTTAATAE